MLTQRNPGESFRNAAIDSQSFFSSSTMDTEIIGFGSISLDVLNEVQIESSSPAPDGIPAGIVPPIPTCAAAYCPIHFRSRWPNFEPEIRRLPDQILCR